MRFSIYAIIFTLLLNTTALSANTNEHEPKLNWNKSEKRMRHFRTLNDAYNKSNISHVGLDGHYLSGSGQFSADNLCELPEKVFQVTNAIDKIIIVDLRMESHGFINGLPVEWKIKHSDANMGKSVEEILLDERERLSEVLERKIINQVVINTISTEEKLVVANGMEYVRLPTLDHSRPSDVVVDDFINLLNTNPRAWFHAHCHVGKGRTTTFMVMYDMFYNAKNLEFKEILSRHKAIGGEDLKKHFKDAELDQRKWLLANERFDFLKRFYSFCKEADPKNTSWQLWLKDIEALSMQQTQAN